MIYAKVLLERRRCTDVGESRARERANATRNGFIVVRPIKRYFHE